MYDASHELQYLNMVIEETLRMYPPAPGLVHYLSFFSSSLVSAPIYDIMNNIVKNLMQIANYDYMYPEMCYCLRIVLPYGKKF